MQSVALTAITLNTAQGIREVGKGSWKKREVGKSKMKLERLNLESSSRSWKVRGEVGKLEVNLESSS